MNRLSKYILSNLEMLNMEFKHILSSKYMSPVFFECAKHKDICGESALVIKDIELYKDSKLSSDEFLALFKEAAHQVAVFVRYRLDKEINSLVTEVQLMEEETEEPVLRMKVYDLSKIGENTIWSAAYINEIQNV